MNINLEKKKLIDQILEIDDEKMITKIKNLMSETEYKIYSKPMNIGELMEKIKISENDIIEGNLVSHDEVKSEILKWRESH